MCAMLDLDEWLDEMKPTDRERNVKRFKDLYVAQFQQLGVYTVRLDGLQPTGRSSTLRTSTKNNEDA